MDAVTQPSNLPMILLIDDDFINREVIKNILQTQYSFLEAENGLDGLQLILQHEEQLSAILLDVNMPIMNGIELLQILHTQGVVERVPIFLITANWEDEISRQAYDLGVMDVIAKPVTPHIILRRVSYVVELFAARKTLSATVKQQGRKLAENAVVIDEIHRSNIIALSSAIESRDVDSGTHTNRIYFVTKYLLSHTAMGNGFTAEDIENMAIGSIMHDVGKIAISDVILNKPGRLTKEEFEVMKQHTVKGERLLQGIMQMQKHPAYVYGCDIARHHHERWDGRGYPDGLKGEEISVWSQVVSIADVYDALINPRVYKRSFSPDEAVQMIVGGECGAFNPLLIECFLQAEPEIRRWYESEFARGRTPIAAQTVEVHSEKPEVEASHEVTDVLLLMTAVKNAYDMIICSNLTQNTFYMIDYDRFKTHCADYDGIFDDLIAAGASTIPDSHKEQFIKKFSRENLLRAFAEGVKTVSLEHPQYSDDGQLHMVMTIVLLLEDPRTGNVLNITLARYIDEEYAERSRQRQALTDALALAEQANHAKSDFLSRMSHDIRTPLNAIIGMSTIIASDINNPEKIAECLVKISTSSKFLLNLINDILDFSKIESGRLSLTLAEFDLRNMVREIAQVISARIGPSSNQSLRIDIAPQVGSGYVGDEFRIRQVLMNLLDNACKYTPSDGHIELHVALQQRTGRHHVLSFRVKDNGVGIRADFLAHLFDPFSQDKPEVAGMQGIGLGLSITRNLVHLMNGELTVESEEGVGSVFTVELPLDSVELTAAVPSNLNVLVVDDEMPVCEHTVTLLERMQVRASFALSGMEALSMIQRHLLRDPYDVIIVDWKMPEMDGVETVRRIRRIMGHNVLVVVMSAYDWTEIEETARAAGVDLFLAKPIYEYNLRSALSCSEKLLQSQPEIVFSGEKVLVAEDNELNQEVVKTILEMKNLQVVIARNGREAVDLFTASAPGEYLAVLMDVMMPVMNGHEAARLIRSSQHEEGSTIPIYAMTANAFQDDVADAQASGMNGHIAKPIDFDDVTRILQRILAAKR